MPSHHDLPLPRSSAAILAGLAFGSLALGGCGEELAASAPPTESVPRHGEIAALSSHSGHFRFFSPTSFWNTPLASSATLDRTSRAVTRAFAAAIQRGRATARGPTTSIDTTSYSVPIYTVGALQPTVRVALYKAMSIPALSRAWTAVPLPADAHPATGTDGELAVWQPSRERLWEFWRLARTGKGWRASFGGAMRNVSANRGVYEPGAWPGATSGWGASASSLPIVGGLITLADLRAGEINHAVAMSIPDVRAGTWALPAQRTDGASTSPLSLPEGAHLRLDPGIKLATLHLPRLTLMIARAAQRYGVYIRDTSPNVGFYGQDPTPTGADPYVGPGGYFEGRTTPELLAAFPWSHLQLLRMRLRRARPERSRLK